MAPEELFIAENEYADYSITLDGLRARIVSMLPLERRMSVLDVTTGSVEFAIELSKRDPTLKIITIDLLEHEVKKGERRIKEKWLEPNITIRKMDATHLDFQPSTFGLVTNFMGLDDIHMIRGPQGVRQAVHEVARVLKPRGYFFFTINPPEEAETPAQKLECEAYSYACGATWLRALKYHEFLRGAGFTLLKRDTLYTGKKLQAEQAMEQLNRAILNAKKYGVEAITLDEVWKKYGAEIRKEGLGHCSRSVLMIARKNS